LNPDKNDLLKAKDATRLPVLIGSGMNVDNIADYLPLADGFIVGSYFRKDGKFLEKLEPGRLNKFIEVFVSVRKSILH
jgi:predicted TIM-barrel enzyme